MDTQLALLLHGWARSAGWLAGLVSLLAQDGVFVLPVALATLWLRSTAGDARRQAALVGCAAAVVAFGLGLVLERTLQRARPFVALSLTPLLPHVADSSFPSDHTLTGVALVGALLWRAPGMAGALVLWALLVGLARVAAGLHYPSDILGSAGLGLALDLLAWRGVPPLLALAPERLRRQVQGSRW